MCPPLTKCQYTQREEPECGARDHKSECCDREQMSGEGTFELQCFQAQPDEASVVEEHRDEEVMDKERLELAKAIVTDPFDETIDKALALWNQFENSNRDEDLNGCIWGYEKALTLRPIAHPDRSDALYSIDIALQARFGQHGNIADLEQCIDYNIEFLELCPIGHPDRSLALNSLGNGLNHRYRRRGDMIDLEKSIRHHKEALLLRPTGHPQRSITLNNLGAVLDDRFRRMGNMTDLQESISHHEEALLLRPVGHPDRPLTLNSLGNALGDRFARGGDAADLEESMRHHEEALSHRPIGHPARPITLTSLGIALHDLSWQRGNIADLNNSINRYEEALRLSPIGDPDRSRTLKNLGDALESRFIKSGNRLDADQSILRFQEATTYTLAPLWQRLAASNAWIHVAREHGSETLGEAYVLALDLLDRSVLLAASSVHDSHARMTHSGPEITRGQDMAADAASYAIEKGQLGMAVEQMERGRAVLFTQIGNYRTPLDELEVANQELAARFRALSAAVERSALSDGAEKVGERRFDDAVGRRQKQADDWDRTLSEIRQLEGFESFLCVTPFVKLQQAAAHGPVILVNISHYRSDALIVQVSGEPICVVLPAATPSAVKTIADSLIHTTVVQTEEYESNETLTKVLRDIWDVIVEPIVFQLQHVLQLPRGSRICWVPTSSACSLPLHAAGPYKPGLRNLPDLFVSSYTPTLSGLACAGIGYQPMNRLHRVSGPQLLVVAHPGAEGGKTLEHVRDEVNIIRHIAKEITTIEGNDCTRDSVLAALKSTTWVHFACHGEQHPTKPFKSRFRFQTPETTLTLLDIIQKHLPQAELAVLSACHSAAGDRSTPDEAIHLAAGMLFAGFRSVVGTMWAMDDRDGPVLTEAFYKYMFRNGPEAVDCRDAARGLAKGIKELRRRGVPLERWINFVHFGI
ncbi:hypothetical protein FRB96_003281 [Tulasnella sp. 330]|nr:hypothetical protein FRB96_003281 [Tulasnella sp. 330]KAG8871794.1 hypothetical protein FRB98_000490 [Tulasnella sp. 332]